MQGGNSEAGHNLKEGRLNDSERNLKNSEKHFRVEIKGNSMEKHRTWERTGLF